MLGFKWLCWICSLFCYVAFSGVSFPKGMAWGFCALRQVYTLFPLFFFPAPFLLFFWWVLVVILSPLACLEGIIFYGGRPSTRTVSRKQKGLIAACCIFRNGIYFGASACLPFSGRGCLGRIDCVVRHLFSAGFFHVFPSIVSFLLVVIALLFPGDFGGVFLIRPHESSPHSLFPLRLLVSLISMAGSG